MAVFSKGGRQCSIMNGGGEGAKECCDAFYLLDVSWYIVKGFKEIFQQYEILFLHY